MSAVKRTTPPRYGSRRSSAMLTIGDTQTSDIENNNNIVKPVSSTKAGLLASSPSPQRLPTRSSALLTSRVPRSSREALAASRPSAVATTPTTSSRTLQHTTPQRTPSTSSRLLPSTSSTLLRSRGASTESSSAAAYTSENAPITAVRRPAHLVSAELQLARKKDGLSTPSTSSEVKSAFRSPKASTSTAAVQQPSTSIRRRSSIQPPKADVLPSSKPQNRIISRGSSRDPTQVLSTSASQSTPVQTVTKEEYAALVAMLSAKQEELDSAKREVMEIAGKEADLAARYAALSSDRDTLLGQKQRLEEAASVAINSPTVAINSMSNKRHALHRTVPRESPAPEDNLQVKKEMDELKKQYDMQETLLLGFQRENEKAMTELVDFKKREKHLIEHLKKVYGPTFSMDILDLPSASAGNSSFAMPSTSPPIVSPMAAQARRHSGLISLRSPLSVQMGREDSGSIESMPEGSESANTSPATTFSATYSTQKNGFDAQSFVDQLNAVQDLVGRFEQRLLQREKELMKQEALAKEQTRKAEQLLKKANALGTTA